MDASMIPPGAQQPEEAKVWRVPCLEGSEMMRARFARQNFSRHFHRRFALGVIEQGGLRFHYLGQEMVAAAGQINLCLPGEVHDGQAAGDQGWRYRMFYLESRLLEQAAGELTGRQPGPPAFAGGVIQDPELAGRIWSLHCDLEARGLAGLEVESRLLLILTSLIARHGRQARRAQGVRPGEKGLGRARELIEAEYARNPSLDELSSQAGLSRFHFLRSFRARYGLTPHAYLNLVRLRQAKGHLGRGWPIADAAAMAGFADQSHLSRAFKKTFGITPGQFSNSLQYPA